MLRKIARAGKVPLLLSTSSALAGSSFELLGVLGAPQAGASYAHAISADGRTVVGRCSCKGGTQAFRWTAASGMVGLGDENGPPFSSSAYAVSSDGRVIVGGPSSKLGSRAFRWTEAGGFRLLAPPPASPSLDIANGVSGNGQIVVGNSLFGSPDAEAFRWTTAGATLLTRPGGFSAQARGISADGTIIVGGIAGFAVPEIWAVRWTNGGSVVEPLWPGLAYAASADGSQIVGELGIFPDSLPVRWDVAGGQQILTLPSGPFTGGRALACSADGGVIVGELTDGLNTTAFHWDAAHGIRTLNAVFADAQVVVPAGEYLTTATGVSADGLHICGTAMNESLIFTQAWVAELPGDLAVNSLSPDLLPSDRATSVMIYGQGFTAGLTLRVGGADLTNVVVHDSRRITATVPGRPAGIYDLEVFRAGQRIGLFPQFVRFDTPLLPPPIEVEAVHLGSQVHLSWASLTAYSQIRITGPGLDVLIPGSRLEFIADTGGRTGPLSYTLSGIAGGLSSLPATVWALPAADLMRCSFGVSVADSSASDELIDLAGGGAAIARSFFRFSDFGYPVTALEISARVLRRQLDGQLRARLLGGPNLDQVIADNIPIADVAWSNEPVWRSGVYVGLLPKGNYAVEWFVNGGSPGSAAFSLLQADVDDPGAPFPCPPYAWTLAQPYSCGAVPPQIQSITRRLILPGEAAIGLSGFDEEHSDGFPAAPQLSASGFLVNATDADGQIVSYDWTIRAFEAGGVRRDVSRIHSSAASIFASLPKPGLYEVEVTVRDNDGLTATASTTFNKSPAGPPPPAGGPPRISEFGSNCPAFVPDVQPAVLGRFRAFVQPAAGATIQSVTLSLIHPTSGAQLASAPAAPDIPITVIPETYWRAALNMSALPPLDSVIVRIRATHTSGSATSSDHALTLCPSSECFDLSFVRNDVRFDENECEYTFNLRTPPNPIFQSSYTVPIIGTLNNLIDAKISTLIRMRDRGWSSDPLNGDLIVKLLNIDILNKHWDAPAVGEPTACPNFRTAYQLIDRKLHETWRFDKQIFRNAYITNILGIDVLASLRIYGEYDTCFRLLLELLRPIPCLALEGCLTPRLLVGADASVTARALILALEGGLTPELTVKVPTALRYVLPDQLQFNIAACFDLDVDWFVRGCIDYWVGQTCTGRITGNLFDRTFGDGCGSGSPCNPPASCPPGATLALSSLDGDGPVEEAGPRLRSPVIASSAQCDISLIVYVDDRDPSPSSFRPDLYFSVDMGSGYTPFAPLWMPDEFTDRDPQLAFLSPDTAALVWTRNVLTHTEASALGPGRDSLNEYFRGDEIFYAFWNIGSGWTLPQRLTNNSRADGVAKLAAAPGRGEAWITWIGIDSPELMLDAGGGGTQLNVFASSIYARRMTAAGPVGPEIWVTSDDVAGPAADFEPAIAMRPDSSDAALFFVREGADPESRRLMYARLSGGGASAPATISELSAFPGADMPSAAIAPDGTGVLAFTSRTGARAGAISLTPDQTVVAGVFRPAAADGGELEFVDVRSLSFFRCASLSAFGPVSESAASGPQLIGQWPQVRYLGGGEFAIGFRGFSTRAGYDADGEVTAAYIDLAVPQPTWTIGTLTDDDRTDLEISFACGTNNRLRTVRSRPRIGSPPMEIVAEDFIRRPDLAITSLELSDRYPQTGVRVRVTATLRNNGLTRASAALQNTVARFGYDAGGSFQQLAATPIAFTARPGQTQVVSFDLVMPPSARLIRVQVDPLAEERVYLNNGRSVQLGVATPLSLTCRLDRDSSPPRVMLSWENADAYEAIRVYRDGRQIARLPGFAGSYQDADGARQPHVWTIRGVIRRSLSERGGALCALSRGCGLFGDSNCDDRVDFDDITPFVTALVSQANWEELYGCDFLCANDVNHDGSVDFDDIGAFVECLVAGGCP